jgi:hypothetical protein
MKKENEPMIQSIWKFFRRIGDRIQPSDLDRLDAGQVHEIARDIGVATDDLYRLDRLHADAAMMPKRLSQEGINPAVIQAEWPAVWKDLQRVCGNCRKKEVCRNELELAPDAQDWRRYCPNEHTIRTLG